MFVSLKNYIKKIINNEYMFSIIAKILGVAVDMISSIFYNRFLGTELRGEAAYVTNVISIASVILGFGIYQAYPYYKRNHGEEYRSKFINACFLQFFIYIIIALTLAVIFGKNVTYLTIILLVPLSILIKQFTFFILIETPKKKNLADITINVSDALLNLLLFLFVVPNYYWMVFLILFKDLVWLFMCLKNINFKLKDIKLKLKDLIAFAKFGTIPMITTLMMTLNYRVDVLMLKGQVSMSDIGIYSLGVSLAEKAWLLPDALKDILLSKLSKGKNGNEVAKVIKFSLLGSFILILGIVFLGQFAIELLYGEEFSGAYNITIILFLGIIGMIFYKMVAMYNVVHKKQKVTLTFLTISVIANLLGNIILIPRLGLNGAAITSVLSYTSCGLLCLIYFSRVEKIKILDILFLNKEDIKYIKQFIGGKKKNENRDIDLP